MLILKQYQQKQNYLSQRLLQGIQQQLTSRQQCLLTASQTLNAISPLATLKRGYALVIKQPSGELIQSTQHLKPGDLIETRLAEGRFSSEVKVLYHSE